MVKADDQRKRKSVSSSMGHRFKEEKTDHEEASSNEHHQPLNQHILAIPFLFIVAHSDLNTGTAMFPSVDGTSFGTDVLPAECAIPNPKGKDLFSVAQKCFRQSPLSTDNMSIHKLHEPLISDDYQKFCSQLLKFSNQPIYDLGPGWAPFFPIPPPAFCSHSIEFVVVYLKDVDGEDNDEEVVEDLYQDLRDSLRIHRFITGRGVVLRSREPSPDASSSYDENDVSEYGTDNQEASNDASSLTSRTAEDQGTERQINNGCYALRVRLYNDVFAEFLRTREYFGNNPRGVTAFTNDFLSSIHKLVTELVRLRAGLFSTQDCVDRIVITLMKLLGDVDPKIVVRRRTKTGGESDIVLELMTNGEEEREREATPLIFIEIKPGAPKSDDMVQATRGWLAILKNIIAQKTVTACSAPCFLISINGLYLAVGGAVLPSQPITNYLSDYQYLPYGDVPTNDNRRFEVACTFAALRVSINSLVKMYKELYKSQTPGIDITLTKVKDISTQTHSRFFPWPRSFIYKGTDNTFLPRRVAFRYISPLSSINSGLVFKVQVVAQPDPKKGEVDPHPIRDETFRAIPWLTSKDPHDPVPGDLVVKFVLKYGRDAHHAMAAADRAPKLYSYEPFEMCGGYWGLKMVVMGFVEGTPLADVQATRAIKQDVKQCVAVLRDLGFVHGDLCKQNFIVDRYTKLVNLIGFDNAVRDTSLPSVNAEGHQVDESSLEPLQRIFKYCSAPEDDHVWRMIERGDMDRTINAETDAHMLESLLKGLTK